MSFEFPHPLYLIFVKLKACTTDKLGYYYTNSFNQGTPPFITGYAGFFSALDFEISTDMGCLVINY